MHALTPPNNPQLIGKYGSPMECLGYEEVQFYPNKMVVINKQNTTILGYYRSCYRSCYVLVASCY